MLGFLAPLRAFAIGEEKPLHSSADKQVWDRKTNKVQLFGHAIVHQPGEVLSADYILLDMNARTLDAKGNCVYIASDSIINGDEMHFNLDTRTGTIVGGRVSNERFTLAGERINKLGEGRFQTHWGDYSTCHDCAQSWTFEAEDVDLEFGGYAYMSNVMMKIKDAPAFWLPYLVAPLKTQRQTGVLFPTFRFSQIDGFVFVLPFFWAINRSADMTLGLGEYTARGNRVEWEGRYAVSPRSGGRADVFYTSDKSGQFPHNKDRWALNLGETQELPFGIEQKLRLVDFSDNFYPIEFADVDRGNEMEISSDLIFSYANSDISAYAAARRFRNILNSNGSDNAVNGVIDPNTVFQRGTTFDSRTVQVFPTAAITTNDRFLFDSPVAAGITLGVTNFTRTAGAFDYFPSTVDPTFGAPYTPGIDPIRKATRASITPTAYTTLRPFDTFSLVPSARYYSYFYTFHQQDQIPNLNRSYLLLQADLSTQLERIYDLDDPRTPRLKHLIRPILTYSYIPPSLVHEDRTHPFLRQIQYAQSKGYTGAQFDNYDIVPIDNSQNDTNYFVPLGNSLSIGGTTQLIERRGPVESDSPTYLRLVEFSAGESINFREYQRQDPNNPPEPLSRFFSSLDLQSDRFVSSSTYYYYPYISNPRNVLSSSLTYILERAVHQRVLTYDRSITLGYNLNQVTCPPNTACGTNNLSTTLNFSVSDYLLPSFTAEYSFVNGNTGVVQPSPFVPPHFLTATGGLVFQSPSQCYKISTSYGYTVQTRNWTFAFDLALNLTGSGFGGVTDVAGQAMSH